MFVIQSSGSKDCDDDLSPSSTATAHVRGMSPAVSLLLLAMADVVCGVEGVDPAPTTPRSHKDEMGCKLERHDSI